MPITVVEQVRTSRTYTGIGLTTLPTVAPSSSVLTPTCIFHPICSLVPLPDALSHLSLPWHLKTPLLNWAPLFLIFLMLLSIWSCVIIQQFPLDEFPILFYRNCSICIWKNQFCCVLIVCFKISVLIFNRTLP